MYNTLLCKYCNIINKMQYVQLICRVLHNLVHDYSYVLMYPCSFWVSDIVLLHFGMLPYLNYKANLPTVQIL